MRPTSWEEFKGAFIHLFFLLELRDAKVKELINLLQGTMYVWKYSLNFNKLSKYAPFMVADPRSRISKFIFRVIDLVSKKCKTAMLIKEIDISHLMTYMEKIRDRKLREHDRESKRDRIKGGGFSHQKAESGGHGKFGGRQKKVGQGLTNVPSLMFNKDKGFDPKAQGCPGTHTSLNCKKCERLYKRECLVSSNT